MTTGPMAPHHRRAVAIVIVSTLVVLALATGSLVAVFYQRLDADLQTGQAIKHEATKKTAGPKTPLNILVMGIDTRNCAGCHVDSEAGAGGSDTNILVHISADRKTAYGISIPRDALVNPVPCTEHSLYLDTGLVQWNAAYGAGGPACTAEQLEKNFGIYVDGYLTVNFGGFKDMVDAIGGVNICIPFELNDPVYEKVDFKPGPAVHLNGTRALAYVRLRHVLDGSDTARIKRQQAFISAMTNKVVSAGTLTNPVKVAKFAGAAASSLTASPGFDTVSDLAKLAEQLKHTDLTHIHFITIPSQAYDVPRTDPRWGRVEILPAAAALWQRVSADRPLSRSLTAGSVSADNPPGSATPSNTPSGSTSPSGQPSSQAAQQAAKSGLCS